MRIKTDKTKCTGCLLCEITCSLLNTGKLQREASAIRIKLADLTDSIHEPFVCRQCKKMKCLNSEGVEFDEEERSKFVWKKMDRIENCPFNSIFVFMDKIHHCNLCNGDPECVKSCPTGAIYIDDKQEESTNRL